MPAGETPLKKIRCPSKTSIVQDEPCGTREGGHTERPASDLTGAPAPPPAKQLLMANR